MSRESTLYTVGALIIASPFIGLPLSWLSFMLPVLGAIILVLAYLARKERIPKQMEMPLTAPPPEPAPAYESSAPSPIA